MNAKLAVVLIAAGAVASIAAVEKTGSELKLIDRDYAYVVKVQAGDNNYLYINVSGNFHPVHGCQNLAFARSRHQLADPRTEAILRIATASLLSGNAVHAWTTGCIGPGTAGYPILTDLQMNRQ